LTPAPKTGVAVRRTSAGCATASERRFAGRAIRHFHRRGADPLGETVGRYARTRTLIHHQPRRRPVSAWGTGDRDVLGPVGRPFRARTGSGGAWRLRFSPLFEGRWDRVASSGCARRPCADQRSRSLAEMGAQGRGRSAPPPTGDFARLASRVLEPGRLGQRSGRHCPSVVRAVGRGAGITGPLSAGTVGYWRQGWPGTPRNCTTSWARDGRGVLNMVGRTGRSRASDGCDRAARADSAPLTLATPRQSILTDSPRAIRTRWPGGGAYFFASCTPTASDEGCAFKNRARELIWRMDTGGHVRPGTRDAAVRVLASVAPAHRQLRPRG